MYDIVCCFLHKNISQRRKKKNGDKKTKDFIIAFGVGYLLAQTVVKFAEYSKENVIKDIDEKIKNMEEN